MAKEKIERLQVNIELEGDDLRRFLLFKKHEVIKANSAAGYKLLVERLNQVMPPAGPRRVNAL